MFPADLSVDIKNDIENFVLNVLRAVNFDNGLHTQRLKLQKMVLE